MAASSTQKLIAGQRRLRRELEKRLRGYFSEAALYASFPFQRKSEPETRFVIFCYQRTGSTLLVDLLASHPLIRCQGELLLNRLASPRRYLACQAAITSRPAFGFKLQPHHFTYQGIRDPAEFVAWLDRSGYRILKLSRQQRSSALPYLLYYAVSTGTFHQVGGTAGAGPVKLAIDPRELLSRIEWIEQSASLLDRYTAGLPGLELNYEATPHAERQQQATVDRICDWLGLPHAPVASKFVKMMPQDISQFIQNAAEIEAFIRRTKYAGLWT